MIKMLRQQVNYEHGRGRQIKRILHMILMMSGRGYTLAELADRMEVSVKTIRRDIVLIEDCDVPVYMETAQLETCQFVKLWRVDPRWMSKRLQEGASQRVTAKERRTGISWQLTPTHPRRL